jgi:hypothetical protein
MPSSNSKAMLARQANWSVLIRSIALKNTL